MRVNGEIVVDDVEDVDELELPLSRARADPPMDVPFGVVDGAKFRSHMEIFDASPPTINVRPSGNSLTERIYASRLYNEGKPIDL